MTPLPDLESLHCFVLAATHASFRTAAQKASLSPAAFGARIRRLEEQFRTPLFARTTRRVALTARGAALLPQARRCVEEAELCAMPLDREARAPFDLVVGTRFEVGMTWVVPALGALERARSERRLHTVFGDMDELLPRLVRDEVHLVLTTARLPNPKLTASPVREIEYVLVGAPRLIAAKPFARPEDTRHHLLLDLDVDLPLFRLFREARPKKERWAFERVQYLSIIAAIRARALEGVGVAVLPLFYVRDDIARRKLRVLMPQTKLQTNLLRAVWRKGHPYEAEIKALASELALRAQG